MESTLSAADLPQSVRALADGEEFVTAAGTTLTLYFSDTGSKDSSLMVSHGDSCVYNHTDNWITPEKMSRIGDRWDVGLAFQCYAGVGSFPSYMLWPLDYRISAGDSKKTQLFERPATGPLREFAITSLLGHCPKRSLNARSASRIRRRRCGCELDQLPGGRTGNRRARRSDRQRDTGSRGIG